MIVLSAGTILADVDLDLRRDEVGVALVHDLKADSGLAVLKADDVKVPSAVFGMLLDFGDAFIADFPA